MSSQKIIDDLSKKAKVTLVHAQAEKKNLPFSKGVLLISVGQPAHEGIKLAATINMVSKQFSSCDVVACDSLQRHTMEIYENLSKETLYAKANIAGEEWLKRNDAALNSFKIPHEIFRWDKYLLDNNFNKCLEKIHLLYKEDKAFANAMNETIEAFVERHIQHGHVKDRSKAFNCCFNFLIEECAVIVFMWPNLEYNYIIYPGKIPKVLEFSLYKFLPPVSSNLLRWLGIYVRTKNRHRKMAMDFQEKELA